MGWQRPEVFSLRSAPTIRVKEQRLSRRGMTRTICVCLSFCRKADSERRWSSVWIVTYPEYGHSWQGMVLSGCTARATSRRVRSGLAWVSLMALFWLHANADRDAAEPRRTGFPHRADF